MRICRNAFNLRNQSRLVRYNPHLPRVWRRDRRVQTHIALPVARHPSRSSKHCPSNGQEAAVTLTRVRLRNSGRTIPDAGFRATLVEAGKHLFRDASRCPVWVIRVVLTVRLMTSGLPPCADMLRVRRQIARGPYAPNSRALDRSPEYLRHDGKALQRERQAGFELADCSWIGSASLSPKSP